MAEGIQIAVGDDAEKVRRGEPVGDQKPPPRPAPKVEMDLRKTMSGDYAINDHYDLDIVVMPASKKILAMPKNEMCDEVYGAQDRLFNYLRKKGVIVEDSVHAGNVYGSMQGKYPDTQVGGDADQIIILSIGKFLQEEKPYYAHDVALEAELTSRITDPEEPDKTELGDVPQEEEKGSVPAYPAMKSYYRVYESRRRGKND
jgi:hypothetical protein